MIPRETLQKIKATIGRIEITTRRVVNETLAGQYHSVFKGQGMEFNEVREYAPGDDIRSIDWNVTARMGHPFTKQYVEERELTVVLLVDASASMDFGTTSEFKHERAAEISALLAFAAIKNNDRVGLVIFTDEIEMHLPPRKGRHHALRLVRDVLFFQPGNTGSDIAGAAGYLGRTQKKKSVIFLISDFLDRGFHKPLQILAQRHDLVAIQMQDPKELAFPGLGLLRLRDPETGKMIVVDTSSRRWRDDYETRQRSAQDSLEKFFKANGIDHIIVRTDEPYDSEIVRFFRARARRML